jgi:hypothetical protein
MKPITWRPFAKEDFSEAPWMERLIRPLNLALGQIQAGVSRGLTFGDNLNAEVRTIDVGGGAAAVAGATDTAWHVIGGVGEPAYTGSPAFSDYGSGDQPSRYKRDATGTVFLQLSVTGGATGQPVFTLPEGFRPAGLLWITGLTNHGAGPSVWSIASTGVVTLVASGSAPFGLVTSFPADDYTAPAGTAETSSFPVKFQTTVRGKAIGVLVLRAVRLSGRNESPVTGLGGAAWDQDGATISLRGVTGISPGSTYRLTLLVVGG